MNQAEQPLNVLVVEDDDADAMMIEEALLSAGRQTVMHRVTDGIEALTYLRGPDGAPRPHLILLDLNMPRMGGHEFLAEVKSDDDLKAIPVVVLTTSSAVPDVMASYRHWANAHVVKPIDFDAFEATVAEIDRFYGRVAVVPRTNES